jgi:hypothetical protein
MNRRFSAEWLDEITSAPMYRYTCNEQPNGGIPMSGRNLRNTLVGGKDVSADEKTGVITWRGPAGQFKAEPVREE